MRNRILRMEKVSHPGPYLGRGSKWHDRIVGLRTGSSRVLPVWCGKAIFMP